VGTPVIGHGIGGSNPIGRFRPQTAWASPLHSLNRAFDEHPWSFVSQTTVLGRLAIPSKNVVLQNLMCTQPAFSAAVAFSKADMSMGSVLVTSLTSPVWLSMIPPVIITGGSAGGALVSSAQAPRNKAGSAPNTICHRRNTELFPFVTFVIGHPFQRVYLRSPGYV
jgi:hypothetical protein